MNTREMRILKDKSKLPPVGKRESEGGGGGEPWIWDVGKVRMEGNEKRWSEKDLRELSPIQNFQTKSHR